MGCYTVENLLNTSADDLKSTLPHVEDIGLLRQAHQAAVDRGLITKALHLERRIRKLKKGVA